MTKDELSLLKKAKERLRNLPRDQQLEWCKEVFPGPQTVRRDFVVFDTSNHQRFASQTVIMHLPSMLWRGFSFSFETALKSLDDPRCDDKELIEEIFRV
jgi:hypothetical protein